MSTNAPPDDRNLSHLLATANSPGSEACPAEAELWLTALRTQWKVLAMGLWHFRNSQLHLWAFSADAAMPIDVQQAFREATGAVSLEQRGFGIVEAVHNNGATIAVVEGDLKRSASWLARFGARSSLAVPIGSWKDGTLMGALAIATTDELSARHPLFPIVVEKANALAAAAPGGTP